MKNVLQGIEVIKKIDTFNKKYLAILVLCFELLLAWADYLTGPLRPFSHFYLPPILVSAFFLGRKWTYFIAFLAVCADIPVFTQQLQSFQLMPIVFDFTSKCINYFAFAYLARLLKKILMTLDKLACEDSLTNAKNARHFYEVGVAEIARAYRSKQPLSLAYVDLDSFKEVNDTKGHQFGNHLLTDIAASIKTNLRMGDMLGRLGGDEFAIMLVQTNQEQAKKVVTRIQEDLSSAIAPYNTNVTFSIGVITYQADKPESMDNLISLADNTMYEVKKSTKNAARYAVV